MKAFKPNSFQSHKEKAARKQREEEEAAAAVYADFVESFEAKEESPATAGPSFVRGETVSQQAGDVGPQVAHRADSHLILCSSLHHHKMLNSLLIPQARENAMAGAAYAPQSRWTPQSERPSAPTLAGPQSFGIPNAAPKPAGMGALMAPNPNAKNKDKNKPKAIDSLLEEMKAASAERQSGNSHAMAGSLPQIVIPGMPFQYDNGTGSKVDDYDTTTTNLYVGNLAVDVTEAQLTQEFSQYGPINSVKIMWPRSEEQQQKTRHSGFVSFMDRASSERAKAALEGKHLNGCDLKLSWSKAVKINGPPPGAPAPGMMHGHGPSSGPIVLPPPPKATGPGLVAPIRIQMPGDRTKKDNIDRTAAAVASNGFDFEALLMEREHSNPRFSFLFETSSSDHMYFKWRAWAYAQGDSHPERWRTEPFQMVSDGAMIHPPRIPIPGQHSSGHRQRDSKRARSRSGSRSRSRSRSSSRSGSSSRSSSRSRSKSRDPVKDERDIAMANFGALGGKADKTIPLKDDEYEELSSLLRSVTLSRKEIAKVRI